MVRAVLTLTLVLLSTTAAHAERFVAHKKARCTLKAAIPGEAKKGKKWSSTTVPVGSTVVVGEEPRKGMVTILWDKEIVSVKQINLEAACEIAATPAPVETAAAAAPAEETGLPKVALAVLAVPPNTPKKVVDQVRELITDIVKDSPSLEFVQTKTMSDAEAQKCNDACARDAAKAADFAITAQLKADALTGTLIFRLLDVKTGAEQKRAERMIAQGNELQGEVIAATKLILREMMPEDAGMLVLKVNEPGVRVTIDGEEQGVTPLNPKKLSGGEHSLTLEKPRFIDKKETFVIEPMRANPVDVRIEPMEDYLREYVQKNTLLRGLAWTGVALAIAGGGATFGLRIGANALLDDLQNEELRLDREMAPMEAYAPLRERARLLPVLDGLTWAAAITGGVGAVTAIVCFILGDDPHRYDKPKRNKKSKDDVGMDWHLQVSPTSVGFAGSF